MLGNNVKDLHSWLQGSWNSWKYQLDNNSFASATLLSSSPGLDTFQLAEQFARSLMCNTTTSEPCGFCHGCDLMQSGNHPDYHVVKPEKEGKTITVEQIRQCNRIAQESSQLSGYRLFVIEPAEAMNESAANALLKTLEEPPEKCVFVLIASKASALLPTIVSRCQQVAIPDPQSGVVTLWLQKELGVDVPAFASHVNGNAPVQTKVFMQSGDIDAYKSIEESLIAAVQGDIESALKCTSKLNESPITRLTWLWYLLTDAQKVHFGVVQPNFTPGCRTLSSLLSYVVLEKQSSELAALIEKLRHFTGLNTELLITDWIFKFNEETCL
ncbi:DNA polymerase III subunit delta' [Vibrio ziniensis]|uniref:DNA polymerase III subunit delta' n=1 Tax=Vibrio ziniensis TaxID=2711221 RepID=A0A6G7CJN4_9VIBR|nr:DNA polymerase III subunit delta' [Vibrio ziniensis]QIH42280.1 DNA polymerase III subunit delta' [Vibrio ziniensis]